MVKNKLIGRLSFALLFIIVICSTPIVSHAQTTDEKTLEIKNVFYGNWKDAHNANHILEIYKDGDLIVVKTRSEMKDGSGTKKYTVTSQKGNRIMVDLGNGATPLTITNDENKISFMGNEYVKK